MSSIDWSLFKQFSRPSERGREEVFAAVAQGYSSSIVCEVARIIREHCQNIISIGTVLETWSKTQIQRPLPEVWHSSISKLGWALFEEGSIPKAELIGRLLIDLSGELPAFDYTFENLSGHPVIFNEHLWSAPGPVRIRKIKNKFSHSGLRNGSSESYKSIISVKGINVIQSNQCAKDICENNQATVPLDYEKTGTFGWEHSLIEGINILSKIAPYYETWVTRVVNSIILIKGLENRTMSGSWSNSSGVIYISEPLSSLEACEILIHESSHQYFHMLQRVSPIKKFEEHGRYYSPAVDCNRPLDMILIAYHAFANVLTFYERAFSLGLGNVVTQNRYLNFYDDTCVLQHHLESSDGLSDLGRVLFNNIFDERRKAELWRR